MTGGAPASGEPSCLLTSWVGGPSSNMGGTAGGGPCPLGSTPGNAPVHTKGLEGATGTVSGSTFSPSLSFSLLPFSLLFLPFSALRSVIMELTLKAKVGEGAGGGPWSGGASGNGGGGAPWNGGASGNGVGGVKGAASGTSSPLLSFSLLSFSLLSFSLLSFSLLSFSLLFFSSAVLADDPVTGGVPASCCGGPWNRGEPTGGGP